ncbi:MAG: trehalose 6-phosphate phosphatase [Actinomycetota bacterium]|nr:trehalose 6-phosphate phosphatase [Actinomycetota bacterium]
MNLVAALAAAPDRAVVVTDFDGTLAPIVRDPAAARPLPGAPEVLYALAATYGKVAVVSGRPAAFLREHLGITDTPTSGLQVFGLYGLEWLERGEVVIHPEAVGWRPVVDEVATLAEQAAPDGVYVERKGFSVTLHVRTSPALAAWVKSWADATAATSGLRVHPGRMSAELRPPVDVDKGTVVDALVDGAGAACFFGDDAGDLPAFDALDRLAARAGADVLRVAVTSDEAPPELLARADLVVHGPPGALAVLEELLALATPRSF